MPAKGQVRVSEDSPCSCNVHVPIAASEGAFGGKLGVGRPHFTCEFVGLRAGPHTAIGEL
jgi:hypothetical protein